MQTSHSSDEIRSLVRRVVGANIDPALVHRIRWKYNRRNRCTACPALRMHSRDRFDQIRNIAHCNVQILDIRLHTRRRRNHHQLRNRCLPHRRPDWMGRTRSRHRLHPFQLFRCCSRSVPRLHRPCYPSMSCLSCPCCYRRTRGKWSKKATGRVVSWGQATMAVQQGGGKLEEAGRKPHSCPQAGKPRPTRSNLHRGIWALPESTRT